MQDVWGSRRGRLGLAVGAFVMTALIGVIDSRLPYVVFAIVYLIPVLAATWYLGRAVGVAVAVASAAFGLAADLWSSASPAGYACLNSVLRLILFTGAALVFGRLHEAIAREREVAAQEQAAAEQLKELAQLRTELVRAVAEGAQEPLAQIYARVVNLGFDLPTSSEAESRVVLTEIAQASARLSKLMDSLLQQDRELVGAVPGGVPLDDTTNAPR